MKSSLLFIFIFNFEKNFAIKKKKFFEKIKGKF